ncbi:MAG TPA: hypothetical protein P5175_08600 [Anaerohalosphaeraceae bacterium]|nr:hypothetical protein [Anaerohalosphaeraceae bacterium]
MKSRLQIIDARMRRLEILYKILAAQRRVELVKKRLAGRGTPDGK